MDGYFTIGDGGIETALAGRLGQSLPNFDAFTLLDSPVGRDTLREYYWPFIEVAQRAKMPLVLDTPTWRANPDWIAKHDGTRPDIERITAISSDGVALVREFVLRVAQKSPVIVNGVVGPRVDDYVAAERMNAAEAEEYHGPQVRALAEAGVDRVTAVTTLDVAEGLGVVRAAVASRVPVVVSFMVGTDGRLADGLTLDDAIQELDDASGNAPLGYAVNCAHPDEVLRGIDPQSRTLGRLLGFRLNAARHGEGGPGDAPADFAAAMGRLADAVPEARVFGGCCGTDSPHIQALTEMLAERSPTVTR